MPTNSEFTDIRMGSGNQSYKQTDREMSGGIEPQVGGPGNPLPQGNYPRTFDRQAGSEPLGEQSDDNPFYYPEKVFTVIHCSGPGQSYVTIERESISGEFTTCKPGETGPYPGTDMVPSPTPSKQFSSKMNGNPVELCNSTRSDVMAHSAMNQQYGLNQPVATLGSHAWLRDSLAIDTESEPGNAVPNSTMKLPKRG